MAGGAVRPASDCLLTSGRPAGAPYISICLPILCREGWRLRAQRGRSGAASATTPAASAGATHRATIMGPPPETAGDDEIKKALILSDQGLRAAI
jgi:hypothetical protein